MYLALPIREQVVKSHVRFRNRSFMHLVEFFQRQHINIVSVVADHRSFLHADVHSIAMSVDQTFKANCVAVNFGDYTITTGLFIPSCLNDVTNFNLFSQNIVLTS